MAPEISLMIISADIGPPLDAFSAACACMYAPVAATSAKRFLSFNISTVFVATKAPMIPASTSPDHAVASHGVAGGSCITTSSLATNVIAPFNKTVTPRVFAAPWTHFFGSASIASTDTGTPREVSNAESRNGSA